MKMKLQDFAQECGVTDRAIQKHIQKHEDALRGHFERHGPNGTWLDDFAQDYIKGLMVQRPLTVVSDTRLTLENEELRQKMALRDEKIAAQDEFINKLQAEIARLNNTVGRLQATEETHKLLSEASQAEAERANQRAERSHQEAVESREKADKETARANALEVELTRQRARENALMNRGLLARILNSEVAE